MTPLALMAIIAGAILLVSRLLVLAAPVVARRWIAALPRSAWAGRGLTAIDMIWVTWLVYQMPLGWFDAYKWSLYLLGPLAFILIVIYVDELLAPRALGGLLLLVATPILDAARWHASEWRLVMVALAYLIVIAGMILVIAPYRLRKLMRFWLDGPVRTNVFMGLGVVVGAALLGLGLWVF